MPGLENRSYDPSAAREAGERRRFVTAETTEASPRHNNEDAFFIDAENGLIALSDGAGGHAAGDKMSQEVMRLVREQTSSMTGQTLDELDHAMEIALCQIIKKSEEFSARITPSGKARAMATLLVAKLIENNGYSAIVKSVGDSLVYLSRVNGQIEKVDLSEDDQLTLMVLKGEISAEDASLVSEAISTVDFATELIAQDLGDESEVRRMLNTGLPDLVKFVDGLQEIKNKNATQKKMLRLAKLVKLFKNYFSRQRGMVTQAVGLPEENLPNHRTEIHTVVISNLRKGDRLILASDGIEGLNQQEIIGVLGQEDGFQEQLENLREAASARSRDANHLRAKPDDITAVGIEAPEIVKKAAAAQPRLTMAERFRLAMRKKNSEATRFAQISESLARALNVAEESEETKEQRRELAELKKLWNIFKEAGEQTSRVHDRNDQGEIIRLLTILAREGNGDGIAEWKKRMAEPRQRIAA